MNYTKSKNWSGIKFEFKVRVSSDDDPIFLEGDELERDTLHAVEEANEYLIPMEDQDQDDINTLIPQPVILVMTGIYFNLITKKLAIGNRSSFPSRIEWFCWIYC